MNRCHVCHGKGIKVNNDLKKITCPKCKGSGDPQPFKSREVKSKVKRKYISKYDGMDKLRLIKE